MNNTNNRLHTRVLALGGLGEVGKNMYVIEHQDELIIIDAGVMFPDDSLLGIDYVLPDFGYLKENEHKIKGLFITHGHEDHIGGIPFLIKEVKVPTIYVNTQAGKLIEKKALDRKIALPPMEYYNEDTVIKFKNIVVTFFATNHSIPDSHGIYVKTPDGTIVATGDFMFDFTPIGPVANLHKMAAIGQGGVTLLLSESTNAFLPGFNMSESKVDIALGKLFEECKGRIILTSFASNVYRVKHVVETCRKNNRKIAVFGRSMKNGIEVSIETGYVKDEGIFISPEVANQMKPEEVCILCTGSQGEPLAALSRIARGTDKNIKLMPTDTVIFSSSPIPGTGNGMRIANTLNLLYLKGVKVYTNTTVADIHASGHARAEELKLMIRLLKPKYFMPVHGEYRMLRAHVDLAVDCDIPEDNTFVMGNGDILEMNNGVVSHVEKIIVNDVYVDGNRIGDTHSTVMRDRKIMAGDGVLVVIANISTNDNKLLGKVNITTRGLILINENMGLMREIEKIAANRITQDLINKVPIYDLKNNVVGEVNNFITNRLDRKPMILTMINDIKNKA